jgi:hypothetical protein
MSFEAKYRGTCVLGDEIEPGQIIAKATGGGFVHLICPEAVPEIKRPVCQTCFQEQAANGTCGCS